MSIGSRIQALTRALINGIGNAYSCLPEDLQFGLCFSGTVLVCVNGTFLVSIGIMKITKIL